MNKPFHMGEIMMVWLLRGFNSAACKVEKMLVLNHTCKSGFITDFCGLMRTLQWVLRCVARVFLKLFLFFRLEKLEARE